VVVSRATLEHARDLARLFALVRDVTTDDAVLIHKIDLRDHGIRHEGPLDFLRFSDATWDRMSSHIDMPNRERGHFYLELGERTGLHTAWAATTHTIELDVARRARSSLAPRFRAMAPEELSILGLWLVQVGPRHPLAKRPRPELAAAPHERLSRF
jgi:hypothetical protein